MNIPSIFVERILRAQREGERLLAAAQFDQEPPTVAMAVEAHRWA